MKWINSKPEGLAGEYRSWHGAKQRCTNDKLPGWKNYGGRGIKVCDRWMKSFEVFLEDMGPKPTPKHSLDRYPDNNGNYEPGNCRWATKEEQCNNTRQTRLITVDGITLSGEQWGRRNGLKKYRVNRRIMRGTPPEIAILPEPLKEGRKKIRK